METYERSFVVDHGLYFEYLLLAIASTVSVDGSGTTSRCIAQEATEVNSAKHTFFIAAPLLM